MTFEDVTLTVDGPVARIAVNRPERRNAMRDRTADELRAALAAAEADDAVRAVILTGEGGAFGAGYDLSSIDPAAVPDLERVLEVHFNPLIRALRASPLPVVTAVNGACAGASVGIALAGDVVIAGRSAFFYEPFAGIALVPDAGNTLFLPRLAGRIRAGAAMLLGDRVPADEAREWGLVWRVVEDDDLAPEAAAVAARLAERAPAALAATKALLGRAADHGLDPQLDAERDMQGVAGRSPEMRAAVDAFLASRGAARGKGRA